MFKEHYVQSSLIVFSHFNLKDICELFTYEDTIIVVGCTNTCAIYGFPAFGYEGF